MLGFHEDGKLIGIHEYDSWDEAQDAIKSWLGITHQLRIVQRKENKT